MQGVQVVDTAFDLRAEVGDRDPDIFSKTLRLYHQVLWSRQLPSGGTFSLDARLRHESQLGSFQLSSDTIVATYARWKGPLRLLTVVSAAPPAEVAAFNRAASAVGAFLVFPLGRRSAAERPQSINQARGIHPAIRDRFDLTLECIRRHYLYLDSPLDDVLGRHRDFFALFRDFRGYVDHFLLNDLVASDYEAVTQLKTFDEFTGDPLPCGSVEEYRTYMARSMAFIAARNARIHRHASLLSADER
ncbi:DUF6994 family protein [Pedococcus sp. NPDC057267]|uniref:DUF6994 family protein n=1 Tax=Pedococcus sp. NPDC057267 TaxID=3346077 RepID=UPI003636EEF0